MAEEATTTTTVEEEEDTFGIGWVKELIKAALEAGWEAIQEKVDSLIDTVLTPAAEKIDQIVGKIEDTVKTVVTSAMSAITTTLTNIWTSIVDKLKEAINTLDSAVTTIIDNVERYISDVFLSIETSITAIIDTVERYISNVFESIEETFVEVVNNVSDKIEEIVEGVTLRIGEIWNSILEKIQSIYESAKNVIDTGIKFFQDAYDSFIEKIKDTYDKVLFYIEEIYDSVIDKINEYIDIAVRWIDAVFSDIIDKIKGIYDTVVQKIKEISDAVIETVTKTVEDVTRDLGLIIDRVIATTEAAIEDVSLALGYVEREIGDLIDYFSENVAPLGRDLFERFQKSVLFQPADAVTEKLKSINAFMSRYMRHLSSAVADPDRLQTMIDEAATEGGMTELIFLIIMTVASNALLLVQSLQVANIANIEELSQNVWEKKPNRKLSLSESAALFARGHIDREKAYDNSRKQGFNDDVSDSLMRASETPIDATLAASALHRNIIDNDYYRKTLKRHGINETDATIHEELSKLIPPIQDLISMSVRDVFSEDVVSEFRLFDDLPEKFVEEAEKHGLSRDWIEKYWGAHWRLPSANQGFEMFHRRVIDESQLGLLLRAIDVSPFWRDKLKKIAYNPITRVDIRRMYRLGVIQRDQVFERHLDLGYSPEDAEIMTQFVVAYVDVATEDVDEVDVRQISMSQIKKLFEIGTIDQQSAQNELLNLGYSQEVTEIIAQSWQTESDIKERDAILKKLLRKIIREDLKDVELQTLFNQYQLTDLEQERMLITIDLERREYDNLPSKTELSRMLKAQVIDIQMYTETMRSHGYSDFWIQKYIAIM
jgi:gas vesicle protein